MGLEKISMFQYLICGMCIRRFNRIFVLSTNRMDTLAHTKPGTTVQIEGIADDALKPKLMEMGLVTGRNVTVLFKAPFGDPIAIDVNGSILSLRLDEAELIGVTTCTIQS
jgi:Fe2+ transport system protein FeoA